MNVNEEKQTIMKMRDFSTVRPHLHAIVRSRAVVETEDLGLRDLVSGCPSHLIAEDMVIRVCALIAGNYIFPSDVVLNFWGVSFPAALQVAIANADTGNPRLWEEIQKGFFLSGKRGTSQDTAAALLLEPDRILRLPVKGQHLVMVLTSDAVAVTGSDDVVGQMRMAQAAYSYYRDATFVSPRVYSMEGGRLVPHRLPQSHPAWILLRGTEADRSSSCSVKQALTINAQSSRRPAIPALTAPILIRLSGEGYQARVLEAQHTMHESSVCQGLDSVNECLASCPSLAQSVASGFRATVRRLQERNCAYVGTFVVWPKNAGPLLLPKADLISFYDPSKDAVEALSEWHSVDGVTSPAGMWPPVFRAERYPDPDVISEMRNVDA